MKAKFPSVFTRSLSRTHKVPGATGKERPPAPAIAPISHSARTDCTPNVDVGAGVGEPRLNGGRAGAGVGVGSPPTANGGRGDGVSMSTADVGTGVGTLAAGWRCQPMGLVLGQPAGE